MRHALTSLALAALCLGPVAVGTAQDGAYQDGTYPGRSPSIIRPVGFGPLWNGYPGPGYAGDCGCGAPAPCPCDPCGSCGPVCDPCCRPILGRVHHAWHKMTRSLDCLFPCRPRLNGDCSGCGTCGIPCGKAYCLHCRPRLLPLLHHGARHGGHSGCASCCAPVAGFAQPLGAPAVEPAPTSDPFQDDPSTPPLPAPTETDARAQQPTHSAQASVLRRTGPLSVVRPSAPSRLASEAKSAPTLPRVQRATHSLPTLKREGSILRRVSAEGDEATHNAPAAGIQSDSEPLPFNPLR